MSATQAPGIAPAGAGSTRTGTRPRSGLPAAFRRPGPRRGPRPGLASRRLTSRPQASIGAELAEWRGVTAGLAAYIEQRAADLAGPMIRMAVEDADRRIGEAAGVLQRCDDLAGELRRRLEVTERQLRQWRTATGHRTVADYQLAAAGWSAIGPGAWAGPAGLADNARSGGRQG